MQTFSYPQSDLDRGTALLRVLGSYWDEVFEARDQLAAYTQAIAAGAQQTQLDLLEAIAALSRFDVPIFHTENWYPVTLHKSQLNTTDANFYKFSETVAEFSGELLLDFNAPRPTDFFTFPAPEKLAGAAHIFDRVLFPTISLVSGADFKVTEPGIIVFTQNPFDLASIPRTPVYNENNELVDEVMTLWAFRAQLDYQYVFRQFSYAVNMQLESGENAKQLMNAVFDGLIAGGATVATLNAALSAVFDVPTTRTAGEIVETISTDRRGVFIATDKHVYRFAPGATPVVEVGNVLRERDALVDTFTIIELNRGELPSDFPALALDKNFTTACYQSDLIFENKEVPLTVRTNHPSGYTYVEFPIAGFPADVRNFFALVHERGVRSIAPLPDPCTTPNISKYGTLAHLLDRRTTPIGEPSASDLPPTINPLQFLVKNVLRNHAFIVIVKLAGLGEKRLPLYNIRHIRQLIPPYAGMFIVYNLNSLRDVIAGAENVQETLTIFKAATPVKDQVLPSHLKDKGAVIRVVSGTCE